MTISNRILTNYTNRSATNNTVYLRIHFVQNPIFFTKYTENPNKYTNYEAISKRNFVNDT